MKIQTYLMIGVFLLAAVAVAVAAEQSPGPGNKPGFDLRRLSTLNDPALDAKGRASRLLSMLKEEVDSPSPTRKGIGGGDITHHYILAQLVACGHPDMEVLRRAAAQAGSGEYKDCIRISLGMIGDGDQVPFLLEYIRNPAHSPWLRERAVGAFGMVPLSVAEAAVPALEAALSDPFTSRGPVAPAGVTRIYRIRQAARNVLLRMEKGGTKLPESTKRALTNVVTVQRAQ